MQTPGSNSPCSNFPPGPLDYCGVRFNQQWEHYLFPAGSTFHAAPLAIYLPREMDTICPSKIFLGDFYWPLKITFTIISEVPQAIYIGIVKQLESYFC